MTIVAIVVMSVAVAWAATFGGLNPTGFEGFQRTKSWYPWSAGGRVMTKIHDYQPPARKSIMVDITGQAHRTADNTTPTKRDRSRLYPFVELKRSARGEIVETAARPILSQPLPPMPAVPGGISRMLHQSQIEEAPAPPVFQANALRKVSVPPPDLLQRPMSLGRKVQEAILADESLSPSARATIKATSNKEKVTLRGVVTNRKERTAIAAKAAKMVGEKNVDNRILVL